MVFWLPLRRSRWLLSLHCLQLGGAMFALWHVDWTLPLRVLALLVLILVYSRPTPPLPHALLFDSYGLQLFYANQRQPAQLGQQCYCSEFLVVLSIRPERGVDEDDEGAITNRCRRWLLLLPDSTDPEALRRLRVYLRWYVQQPRE